MEPKKMMALSMARKLAMKKAPTDDEKCHACGGVMNKMAEGGVVEQKAPEWDEFDKTEGGGEGDGETDDLAYSPEEFGETGFGEVENEEDGGDNEAKHDGFLKAYLIHRKLRKG